MCQAHGCPNPLPPSTRPAPDRKWCSESCRKSQYAAACVDCGAPTSGGEGRKADPRCGHCANIKAGRDRKVWTREAIIIAIQEWAVTYGDYPGLADFVPTTARRHRDFARAQRFVAAEGRYPHGNTVIAEFGSWNAAIRSAGFEPRVANGGAGNADRRRGGNTGRRTTVSA